MKVKNTLRGCVDKFPAIILMNEVNSLAECGCAVVMS